MCDVHKCSIEHIFVGANARYKDSFSKLRKNALKSN